MNIAKLKLWTSAEQQMPGISQQCWSSLTGFYGAYSTSRVASKMGGLQTGLWIQHFDLKLLCNELPLILWQICEPELFPHCVHF